jgi:hypothetical protein
MLTNAQINGHVVSDDTIRRLIPATQSVLFRYSVAHNACGELESLAHRNTRTAAYPASEPPLAFAANRLT